MTDGKIGKFLQLRCLTFGNFCSTFELQEIYCLYYCTKMVLQECFLSDFHADKKSWKKLKFSQKTNENNQLYY